MQARAYNNSGVDERSQYCQAGGLEEAASDVGYIGIAVLIRGSDSNSRGGVSAITVRAVLQAFCPAIESF